MTLHGGAARAGRNSHPGADQPVALSRGGVSSFVSLACTLSSMPRTSTLDGLPACRSHPMEKFRYPRCQCADIGPSGAL